MNRPSLAFLLATTLLAAPVLAQDAPTALSKAAQPPDGAEAIDPAAAALREESAKAVKAIRDLSATVVQTIGPSTARGRFTITIPEKMTGFPIQMYSFATQDDTGKTATQWASDGTQIQKLDHAGKALLTLKFEKGAVTMPPPDAWEILPQWIFEDLFENPQVVTIGAKARPDAQVGGVKCRVVEITKQFDPGDGEGPRTVMTSVRSISVEDKLPRRIETTVKNPDADGEDYRMVVEMTDVKVNKGLTAADFAIQTPDGYEAKDATADQLGMQSPEDQPKLAVSEGSDFPAFTLTDSNGSEVTLASLKGRVVLLDFWATWCGPCKAVMPKIQALHERYKDKAVTIAGVNCWEQKPEAAVKYMANKKYTYSLLLGGDDLAKSLNITGIPTLILIGKDGKVLHTSVGVAPGEDETIAKMIDEQLASK